MTLYTYPAYQLRSLLQEDQISTQSLYQLMCDRIELEGKGAVIAHQSTSESVLCEGPLSGVPLLIEDGIGVKGYPNDFGSALYQGKLADSDHTLVKSLKQAGGQIIGIGNVSELSLGDHTTNLLYGETRHPSRERACLGSSGGIAVGVMNGCAPIGIGYDVGGSLRLSAFDTQLFALKPTHGRVIAIHDIGILARHPKDLLLALQAINQESLIDAYPPLEVEELTAMPLSVGVLAIDPKAIGVSEALRMEGHRISIQQWPFDMKELWNSYQKLSVCDTVARFEIKDPLLLSDQVKEAFELASTITGVEYAQLKKRFEKIVRYVDELFMTCDILLTPPRPFLFPFNLTGHPALITPSGWQLVAHKGHDARLTHFGNQDIFFRA